VRHRHRRRRVVVVVVVVASARTSWMWPEDMTAFLNRRIALSPFSFSPTTTCVVVVVVTRPARQSSPASRFSRRRRRNSKLAGGRRVSRELARTSAWNAPLNAKRWENPPRMNAIVRACVRSSTARARVPRSPRPVSPRVGARPSPRPTEGVVVVLYPHTVYTHRETYSLLIPTLFTQTERHTHTHTHTHTHKTLSHKFKTLGLECENRAIFAKTRKRENAKTRPR